MKEINDEIYSKKSKNENLLNLTEENEVFLINIIILNF